MVETAIITVTAKDVYKRQGKKDSVRICDYIWDG